MAFKYQTRDKSDWERRAAMSSNDFQGVIKDDYKTFTAAKGDNFVRILPATWEYKKKGTWWETMVPHYGLDVWLHFNVGPDRATVLCLNKMKKQRCPVCDAAQQAKNAGDTSDEAKQLNPTHRILVWMLNRRDDQQGPMIWLMPFSLDKSFTQLTRDPESGETYEIDHPDRGYNISFDRTGEGLTTKYIGVQLARRTSSVDADVLDYISNEPLTESLIWRDYDEVQRLFTGGASYDESAEKAGARSNGHAEEEEKPKESRFRARGTAQKEPPRKEPPPAEEEDYGEQGEEEPPPAKEASPPPEQKAKSTAEALRARFGRK